MRISDIVFFLSEKSIEIYYDGSYKLITFDYGTEVGHIQIDYEGVKDEK